MECKNKLRQQLPFESFIIHNQKNTTFLNLQPNTTTTTTTTTEYRRITEKQF